MKNTMKGSKVIKSSSAPFVKGGGNKMAPKGSAGPQKPGQTAQAGRGGAIAAGGGKKMAGFTGAKPAKAK
jgi:hypothetical protein